MKKRLFGLNTIFESNTYYYTDKKVIDVYLKDTVSVSNNAYFVVEGMEEVPTAFLVENKENITLDFCGAKLLLHGLIQPIIFGSCKSITIKNLVIEYERPNMTEMVVTDAGEGFFRVKVKDGYPYKIEDGKFIPYCDYFTDTTVNGGALFMQEFDKITTRGVSWPVVAIGKSANTNEEIAWLKNVPVLLPEQSGDEVIFTGSNIPPYKVGNTLVLAHGNRCISAVSVFDCKDVFIENLRIINGIGMGILPNYTENIYIDGLKLFYDKESKGIATNNADGIHATSCKGDFVIKNSVINHTIDDAINIHGQYYTFISADGNKMKVLNAGKMNNRNKNFGIGDVIMVHNGHSVEDGDEYKIISVTDIGERKKLFELDRKVKRHNVGDLIENITCQPDITIENSSFLYSNTHLRFQSRGKIRVKNCISHLQFIVTGDTNYWFESSPVTDFEIENTEFDVKNSIMSIPEFKSTEKAKYYHKNIKIKNCRFKDENAVYARFADNIVFENNINENGKKLIVNLDNCGSAITDDDVIINRTSIKCETDE